MCQYFYPKLGYSIFMKILAERLKELRISSGLKQSELAAALSVNQRTVSNWENNVNDPDLETVVQIAKYFTVRSDYLLGLED